MKECFFTLAFLGAFNPAWAAEFTIQEVTDYHAQKPHFFSPDTLRIKPGDKVTFENAQDEPHEVMFIEVPKGVDEMIMSPMHEKKGDKFTYTFTVPGTTHNKGLEPLVRVRAFSSGTSYEVVDVDVLIDETTGNVTLTSTENFTGKIVIL